MKKVIRMLFSMTLVTALLFGVITVPSDIISGATSNPAISDSSSGFVVDANAAAKKKKTTKKKEKSSGYVIDKYIKNGKFTKSEWKKYNKKMGGGDVAWDDETHWNIEFFYDNFDISLGTSRQDPKYSYVAVAEIDTLDATFCSTYLYKKTKRKIKVFNDAYVPIEALHDMEKTIKYMKKHPDPNSKPEIEGINFVTWDEFSSW